MPAFSRTPLLLAALFTAFAAEQPPTLYEGFTDPPRQYTVRPFWFWNAKLDAKEVERQIDEMVSQGVYGAYVHNRNGLETPYLSEEYFSVVGAALRKARAAGFLFSVVDEYEWPSGEARDIFRKGQTSRVVAENPEFHMRSLAAREQIVEGPTHVSLGCLAGDARTAGGKCPEIAFQFATAARLDASGLIEDASLEDISAGFSSGRFAWDAPEGKWLVEAWYLRPASGVDGGTVDLMNARAIRTFLDLTYEQYYKRFSEYFGNVIDSTFADHEGSYGSRLAWTPALFETFQKMKGYDLRPKVPLLVRDGGKLTPKVRCDYMDVVSELYSQSFFGQVAEWGRAHKIQVTGHVWEETLQSEAAYDSDLQRIMRRWGWPGVDSLWENGRSPRDFKVTGSVAHFRGTRFTCENQGLQGSDSNFDLQKARLGTNTIAAWGVNVFVPHAFNYHPFRIEYPPDWFFHQPYWKYFKHYADYARRISYMNDGGRHVAPVLLYHPIESAWAGTSHAATPAESPAGHALDRINRDYGVLMNHLSRNLWDYDAAESYYLLQAQIKDRSLVLGNESYRVLVLPPMSTIRREALHKIGAFYAAGGTVIGIGTMPLDSMEEGGEDPELVAMFGGVKPPVERTNAAGGHAIFVREPEDVAPVLERTLTQDVKIISGAPGSFYYLHRNKEGLDYYWLVNDSADARTLTVRLASRGVPVKWDAETGRRQTLCYRETAEGVEASLRFDPWDAYYVVLENAPAPAAPILVATADRPIHLSGKWNFLPETTTLTAPYARVKRDYNGEAERLGWQGRNYPDSEWQRQWLSRERFTIREWSLIGPFPNEDMKGFDEAYAPERGFDPEAVYTGSGARSVQWKAHHAQSYVVDLGAALDAPRGSAVTYAHCYLWSRAAGRVQFRIAAETNAKLWVNGKSLLDWLVIPYYYEMREDFALRRSTELQAGWNEVLVKVCRRGSGGLEFLLRLTDDDGRNLDDLVPSLARLEGPPPARQPETGFDTWYRIPVPPGARTVRLAKGGDNRVVFYNGAPVGEDANGRVNFAEPAQGSDNVLALRVRGAGELRDLPEFTLGPIGMEAGSWTFSGLPYYSGSATYEKTVELPAAWAGRKLLLDLGQVGSAAEVSVNGKPAGVRVWLPYTFDISGLVRPGANTIRVKVTNTMESARAVENRAEHLERIRVNGLVGPVLIRPAAQEACEAAPAVAEARR